ncbi:hypothetical protein HYH02_004295 [Chlamydomonas schloesseri]|uniref:Conserved oligomeric Golgi complex subunit 2 n=1 Tax=Chlamydomonas schloesseri TaxID=2026947 RepID=A0A836B8M9_9CHLO|nr:hypothetical protein HYH02_004295 [Chlamydomonas schloesseri]|eukprot:KAG2451026.1 hypothetical protein HYH02_004295 [Chlamydomonas schloesseri]
MTAEEVSNGGASAADSAVLLGRAACPVWLNPERFLEQEFNADACVADLRRYVPLATLQNELSSYLATLKTKLVEVINQDYADYVGLSGRLANVEGAVVRMRKPLLELRDKLHAVQEAVRTELHSLNQGLRKRKEVATQRALLELILEVSHVAAKVDKLLEEVVAADQHATAAAAAASGTSGGGGGGAPAAAAAVADTASAGAGANSGGAGSSSSGSGSSSSALAGGDLVAQCRLLERVAAEVSRLAFLANKGKDLAFVRSLEPRIAAHRAALRGRLSAALTAALQAAPAPPPANGGGGGGGGANGGANGGGGPRNTAAALHALHAAADLGEVEAAEGAVRRVVVAPLVERLIAEHKAHGPTGGASAGGGGLAGLLASILAGVRRELGPLLDACLAPGSALRGLDLLGAAVLDEVQGALAAALPGVFSPGVPPAFHANYLATAAWLRQLEGLCATRAGVERLRAGPAYGALMRRWNTSVYFSLLFQEIAGELEDALSADKLEPAPAPAAAAAASDPVAPPPPPLALAASGALLRCLRRAASPDVVLPPLTDRFLRLVLQLAQRYATWVLAATAARREAAAAAAAAAGAAVGGAGGGGAPPGTPPGAGAPGGGGGGGALGAGLSGPGAGEGAVTAAGAGSAAAAWAAALAAEELMAIVHDTEAVHAYLAGPFTATFLELLPLPAAATAAATASPSTLLAGASSGTVPPSPLASASSLASLGSMPPPPATPSAAAAAPAADGGGAAAAAAAVAAAVRGALAEAAEAVRSAGRGLAAALGEEAVERCVVVVRQLKGITATYRMTAKAPPSRASHYVSGVLAPLRALLEAGAVRRLAPALQQELLVLPVAEGVCGRYAALADELLVSVRKTESSLKRLKKAKAAGGGEEDAAAAVSDSDKITLQLHLDAAELGLQLGRLLGAAPGEELAAAAAAVPSFRRLQEVVAPPPGLLPATAAAAAAGTAAHAPAAPAYGAAAPAPYQASPPPAAAAAPVPAPMTSGLGSSGGAGFVGTAVAGAAAFGGGLGAGLGVPDAPNVDGDGGSVGGAGGASDQDALL